MVDGFILNNQLTDFSAEPVGPDGAPVPNRVAPGKRPRSTMAPTLIFDKSGDARGPLYATLGSPGGAVIIQFVVKTVVGMVDWGMDPQQAVGMVDFGAANSPKTNVGGEHPNIDTADNGDHDPLVQGLRCARPPGRPRRPVQRIVGDRAGHPWLGWWSGSAPRGAGDGRPPVTARVTRLSEWDWQLFAGVRLQALTDSLGADDPQYRQESVVHRRTVASTAPRSRTVRRAARRPSGRADRCTAGGRRNCLLVLTLARPRRPGARVGAAAGRRGGGLGTRPTSTHSHSAGCGEQHRCEGCVREPWLRTGGE